MNTSEIEMYSIIDRTVLKEEEDFEISASINELLGNLEIDCRIPSNRKVNLHLHSTAKSNVFGQEFCDSGARFEIPLQPLKSDSFTLEVSDENGIPLSRYRIMRSYC